MVFLKVNFLLFEKVVGSFWYCVFEIESEDCETMVVIIQMLLANYVQQYTICAWELHGLRLPPRLSKTRKIYAA
jgi:hypothetical protein